MSEYTVQKNGDTRRYRDGGKLVAADKVPEQAKTALEDAEPGTIVDDLGDTVDPDTESDESTDETMPAKKLADTADGEENTNQKQPAKDGQQKEVATRKLDPDTPADDSFADDPDAEDDGGVDMGFKRSGGKTLSIFSNKPHETVKYVAGVMVPLTMEEYENKGDAEIIEKLKKLKKL